MGVIVNTDSRIIMLANPAAEEGQMDSLDLLASRLRNCYAFEVDEEGYWFALAEKDGRLRWLGLEEVILADNENESYPPPAEITALVPLRER